jgi:hypothetical protein
MVRLDYNTTEQVLRICEQEYILDDGFTTIGAHLSESMAHLFADYVDAGEFDDEIRSSVKAMRSLFNEWRANLYDDDF